MIATDIGVDERGVIVPCPRCGKHNRLPFERLGQDAHCAACQTRIPAPNTPIDVTSEAEFNAVTSRSALPVLVDFWASWCGPCKIMAPELTLAADRSRGKWIALKVNTEELPQPAARFGVASIPLLVLFRGGREVARSAGARPANAIEAFAAQHA